MRHSGHYQTSVVTVQGHVPVADVADRMDLHATGCVVVVDEDHAPIGVITDRDLTRRVVARGLDPDKTTAADVMTPDPRMAEMDEPLERVVARMQEHGVRRLPVQDRGRLVGIVALDDIVSELGRELGDIREAYRSEVLGGRRTARQRRRRENLEALLEDVRNEVAQLGAQSLEWIEREVEGLRRRLGGRP
jgi:CBS domain-containing protein